MIYYKFCRFDNDYDIRLCEFTIQQEGEDEYQLKNEISGKLEFVRKNDLSIYFHNNPLDAAIYLQKELHTYEIKEAMDEIKAYMKCINDAFEVARAKTTILNMKEPTGVIV